MKDFFARQAFLYSLLTTLLLFAAAYLAFYPQYGSLEDLRMHLLASGTSLAPAPSASLPWTHSFIGYSLQQLYLAHPDQPWYGLYLYAAHFIGVLALLYTAFRLQLSWLRWGLAVLFLIAYQLPVLQEIQYTSASATLSMGAWSLLSLAFWRAESRWSPVWYAVGLLFFAVAALMSGQVAWMSALLLLPLHAYVIFQQGGRWWLRLLLLALPIGLGFGLDFAHHQIQAQHPGWKAVDEAPNLAAEILDYRLECYRWDSLTADLYYKNGWSENDFALFTQRFAADSTTFGYAKQAAIQRQFDLFPRYTPERIEQRANEFVQRMPLADYLYYALGFSWLVLVLMGNRRDFILVLIQGIFACLLAAFLYSVFFLPERASAAIGIAVASVALLLAGYRSTASRLSQAGLLVAVAFLFALPTLKTTMQKSRKVYTRYVEHEIAFRELNPKPDQIYAFAPELLLRPLVLPLGIERDTPLDLRAFRAVDFGELANMPITTEQLDAMGVSSSIHRHLIGAEKGFLIHRPRHIVWDLYREYLQSHLLDTTRYTEHRIFPELNIAIMQVTKDTL